MSDLEDFDTDDGTEPTRSEPRRLEEVMAENTETNHNVSESADKIVLKTEVKRGSDTRDQDKVNVKVKGNDPDSTVDKLARTLDALEDREVSTRLREDQPADNLEGEL